MLAGWHAHVHVHVRMHGNVHVHVHAHVHARMHGNVQGTCVMATSCVYLDDAPLSHRAPATVACAYRLQPFSLMVAASVT